MWARLRREALRYPFGAVGALLAIPFFVAALIPSFAPYDPLQIRPADALAGPSPLYWLGTDTLGRDELSRVIYGARPSLGVGFASVMLSVLVGAPLGLVAGYRVGLADQVIMRALDALQAFPGVVLALAIAAALGPGVQNAVLAVALVYVPVFARLIRGQALAARALPYMETARASGADGTRIVLRHLLPNIAPPLLIQVYLTVAYAILLEATLSFLGVGVQPPAPSWGSMLRDGYAYLSLAPALSLVPGATIFVLVLGLTLLGDAIWTASDPEQARRATRQAK